MCIYVVPKPVTHTPAPASIRRNVHVPSDCPCHTPRPRDCMKFRANGAQEKIYRHRPKRRRPINVERHSIVLSSGTYESTERKKKHSHYRV